MNDFQGILELAKVVYSIVQVENSINLDSIFDLFQSLNGHFAFSHLGEHPLPEILGTMVGWKERKSEL